MLFDSRTVYLGASRDKYEQYCKALDGSFRYWLKLMY